MELEVVEVEDGKEEEEVVVMMNTMVMNSMTMT